MTRSQQRARDRGLRLSLDVLEKHGLLLQADSALTSVLGIVVREREPVRGSWWSHPAAHDVYDVGERLHHHPDVLLTKLIARKLTYVHQQFWPDFLRVATAREPWQTDKLPSDARHLLRRIERERCVRTDVLRAAGSPVSSASVRALESRLLVHGDEIHTETGAHAKQLELWPRWQRRHRARLSRRSPESARNALERAALSLAPDIYTSVRLPWARIQASTV